MYYFKMVIPCAICITVIILLCLAIYYSGKFYFSRNDGYFQVAINSTGILFETDEKFLSVALDMSFMRCFFHNLTHGEWDILLKYATWLSPAYLRIGGTDADRAIFTLDEKSPSRFNTTCDKYVSKDNFTITGSDLGNLSSFVRATKLNLIFNLNVLLRNGTRWNSTNAEKLLNYSSSKGISMDFQLGNEPNSFKHVFNLTIKGSQLARDFSTLKKLLNSKSKLIGPDVTKPSGLGTPSVEYLDEFLSVGNSVDVVSWHQYYLKGSSASADDFTSLNTFNLFESQAESIMSVIRKHAPGKPVWISETGSASGGGAPGLSDTYLASFLWLDKLGLAARLNTSVVIRQSFFKGHYALIDSNFTPTADYWVSVLYKHLVGTRVLNVNVRKSERSSMLRFYGHCVSLKSSINGSIIIFGMNIGKTEETGTFLPAMISVSYPVYAFVFQPKDIKNLASKEFLLNNHELNNKTTLNDVLKMVKEVEYPLLIPPYGIGFWILKEIQPTACLPEPILVQYGNGCRGNFLITSTSWQIFYMVSSSWTFYSSYGASMIKKLGLVLFWLCHPIFAVVCPPLIKGELFYLFILFLMDFCLL